MWNRFFQIDKTLETFYCTRDILIDDSWSCSFHRSTKSSSLHTAVSAVVDDNNQTNMSILIQFRNHLSNSSVTKHRVFHEVNTLGK